MITAYLMYVAYSTMMYNLAVISLLEKWPWKFHENTFKKISNPWTIKFPLIPTQWRSRHGQFMCWIDNEYLMKNFSFVLLESYYVTFVAMWQLITNSLSLYKCLSIAHTTPYSLTCSHDILISIVPFITQWWFNTYIGSHDLK